MNSAKMRARRLWGCWRRDATVHIVSSQKIQKTDASTEDPETWSEETEGFFNKLEIFGHESVPFLASGQHVAGFQHSHKTHFEFSYDIWSAVIGLLQLTAELGVYNTGDPENRL